MREDTFFFFLITNSLNFILHQDELCSLGGFLTILGVNFIFGDNDTNATSKLGAGFCDSDVLTDGSGLARCFPSSVLFPDLLSRYASTAHSFGVSQLPGCELVALHSALSDFFVC